MSQNWAPRSSPNAPPAHVRNYLVFAILTTVFCCPPTGVISILYAAQVNVKVGAGDITGAIETSKNAKLWAIISAGLGITGYLIVIVGRNIWMQ